MPDFREFKVACWDLEAVKAAELTGKDPGETPDIWLRICLDMHQVIGVREREGDEKEGTWLEMSNGRCYRVKKEYDELLRIVNGLIV